MVGGVQVEFGEWFVHAKGNGRQDNVGCVLMVVAHTRKGDDAHAEDEKLGKQVD